LEIHQEAPIKEFGHKPKDPSFATISDASQPNTIASNLIAGTYKFVWKIYNERCFTTDTVIYVISKPAFVHAGNDVTLCNNNGQLLLTQSTVSSPDDLAVWSVISGGGILSTSSPTTQPDTVIYTAEPGFSGYILLRLQAEDACRVVTDDKSVFLQQPVVPVDALNDSASTDLGTIIILNVLSNDILLLNDTLRFLSAKCNCSYHLRMELQASIRMLLYHIHLSQDL
jgi:hypothetical protein